MTKQEKRPYHHGDLRRVVLNTAMAMLTEPEGVNFTLREVAEQLEVPIGTIKSALSRGLARLRDRLADDHRVHGAGGVGPN